jgi:hypothetical protein
MRLQRVHSGHGLKHQIIVRIARLMGQDIPGVVRTLWYREQFFGKPHNALTQQVMRGPSEWSVGERELFAAFVSRLNQCPF